MTDLNFYDDPAAFLRDVEDVLARDPVVTTVVSTVTQRVAAADDRREPRGDHPHWWVAVREGDRVVGVAMRTAPFGPVYTPRDARGHGYASATVAAVTQRLLDQGSRAVLFTDQANPTSNKIYEAVGYRPVVDMANLQIG